MKVMKKWKPKGAWKTAKFFKVRLFEPKLPICGSFLVWAVVGYKWVRVMNLVHTVKFKMSRKAWDELKVCDLYVETDLAQLKLAA